MDTQYILDQLDYYKLFSPSNASEEKEKFFQYLTHGSTYNPQFVYPEINKKKLFGIIKYLKEKKPVDPIEKCFLKLYLNVALMLKAWVENDYLTLTKISGNIFGSSNKLKLAAAINYYHKLNKSHKSHQTTYSAKKLGEEILGEFNKLNISGWRVIYDDNNPSEASIYESEKKVILKKNHKYSEESYQRIIKHEIYAHAFQAFNARLNNIHPDYLSSYLGTEVQYEGIAIYIEINIFPKHFIKGILSRYIILMIANQIAAKNSFAKTYDYIYKLTSDQEFSYMAALRAKRGFKDTSIPGTFQKENAYLFGVKNVIDLVNRDHNNYLKLMQGNFPFSVLPYLNSSKTKWNPLNKIEYKKIAFFQQQINTLIK